jgi:hypothetical protein
MFQALQFPKARVGAPWAGTAFIASSIAASAFSKGIGAAALQSRGWRRGE